MKTLPDLVRQLPKEALMQVAKDLEEGTLQRAVKETLLVHQSKMCPVCHNTIIDPTLTLTFGKHVQKQASFCGKDCLLYYLQEETP